MDMLMKILLAAVIAVDCWVWYRVVSRCGSRSLRLAFLLFAGIADIVELVLWPVGKIMTDNPAWWIRLAMWGETLYIISVFIRVALYPPILFMRGRRACIAAAILLPAAVAIPVWGVLYGRKNLKVTKVTVASARLPKGFDGFRVVQFSDLHVGTMLDPEREVRAAVDSVNALHPDMVVFSGDIVTVRYDEIDDCLAAILSEIKAPCGVWSFVGNHDAGVCVKDSVALPYAENRRLILERQRAMGWRVVDDETVWIHRGGDSLSLSGISFPEAVHEDRHKAELPEAELPEGIYDGIPAEAYNITVSHLPQLWRKILDCGRGDLTLAGHYHGMQAGIGIAGVKLSPLRLFHREWSGLYECDGRYLYINDGIGYVGVYMRIGMPPEITLFTFSAIR